MVERLPASYTAIVVLVVGLAIFNVLGFLGVLPVEQAFVWMTTLVLAQAVAVILAFIGGIMVGLFLAHRILGSRDFTPFERAVLEGQTEIKELLQDQDQGEGDGPAS